MRGGLRAIACWCVAWAALPGQEKLTVQGPTPASVIAGESATVTLVVSGQGTAPRQPDVPSVPGLDVRLLGPSETYQNFNGRVSIESRYSLVITPMREGEYEIPSFEMYTGTRSQNVPAIKLRAIRAPRAEDELFLSIEVEPKRVYVNEPFRVHIRFGFQGLQLAEDQTRDQSFRPVSYSCAQVEAPWLETLDGAVSTTAAELEGDQKNIVVNKHVDVAGYFGDVEHGGGRYDVYTIERAYVPTRSGTLSLDDATLTAIVMGHTSDRFGRRSTRKVQRVGHTGSVEVLPIPEAGRPDPYFGAVGRFAIAAALDKTTVKVGSSLKLTLTVSGEGNFEFLRMPAIDELPGFHKLGQAEAKRDANHVAVTYDFTPLSTDVHEVPPIAWNYFDTTPGTEKFVETRTKALPITVQPLANGEVLQPLADAPVKSVTPGTDDIFDLPSFDGPAAVPSRTAAWLGWLAALGPWLVAFVASLSLRAWRRRAADTEGQRARAALRTCRVALDAGGEPLTVLAGYLGDRLGVPAAAVISADLAERLAQAKLDEPTAAEVVAAIERGTAARYGGGESISGEQVEQLVRRLEGLRFGVRAILPLLLLPLLAATVLAPSIQAQTAAAVAAYRAGDFKAAEKGFEAAYAATGDRRCWRARGNCYFRLGQLPEALWAYETARIGMPRDPELLADLRLVRKQLQLEQSQEGFVAELVTLRERLTSRELALLCALCMLGTAGCFVFGWRRAGLRWIGILFLVPGLAIAIELLWLAPARPPLGVALQELAIVSEPRDGLQPIVTVRPGKELEVLGSDQGTFVRVAVGDRTGYAPRERIAVVR